VLTQNSFNVLTSRRNQITKTLNVLDLNGLQDITSQADDAGNQV